MSDSSKLHGMVIVYDGECPFCASYVRLMALKRQTGHVELVDARGDHPAVADLARQGYDLNEGMAAIFGGAIYHGSDAITLISRLTDEGGWAKRMLARLLRDPRRARRIYPILKFGRRLALRTLGRREIPAPLA